MLKRQVALCICNSRGIRHCVKLAVDWLVVGLLCWVMGLEDQIVSVIIGLAIAIT